MGTSTTMTNVESVNAIQIPGRGFVVKRSGNYLPGEYRKLVNASINEEGIIVNRRNIYAFWDADYATLDDPHRIYGHLDEFTIVGSGTQHFAVGRSDTISLWSPASLPIVGASGWHVIVSAFIYNNRYYWITMQWDSTAKVYKYYAYHKAITVDGLLDVNLIFANLEVSTLLTITEAEMGFLNGDTCKVFVQKDRLWIVTRNRLYFSKATDPTVFAIPDGGFFGIRDQRVEDVTFLGDSIFILCNNEVHALTYTSDPNEDAYLRKIGDVGGHSLTVHNSSVYFVNQQGIYEIFNHSINKLMDLLLEYPYGLDEKNLKILSFESFLVIIARNEAIYDPGHYGWSFTDNIVYSESLNYNVFFVNTKTGATHVLDFKDRRDAVKKGRIVDAIVNPVLDNNEDYKLVFLTNAYDVSGTSKGNLYYMHSRLNEDIYDEAYLSTGVIETYSPNIEIEIDSYVPDGSEYAMKKFRSLLVSARFPANKFSVNAAFDDNDFNPANKMLVKNESFAGERPHHPARIPLMQRARSISLRFATDDPDVPLVGTSWTPLEISDLRVLWMPTKRVTDKRYLSL